MYGPQESPLVSVSEAIQLCNSCFEGINLVVEGEISGYGQSRGKFVFFDLKDPEIEAKMSCFMMLFQQNIPLEDGMRVVVRARPSIYAKSGSFRLTVQSVEAKGEGSLKRAFELLKQKLETEGLFDLGRKRRLPEYPTKIGVVSSATAAGYGDFMRIANNRFSGIEYTLVNVAVQGVDAEAEIIAGLDYLNTFVNPDAIVMIRGGGSLEDLHAFNSELVARAIIRSKAPVVVGVGHERDVTIADFCADLRAATPSNAAELVVPDQRMLVQRVKGSLGRFDIRLHQYLQVKRQKVQYALEYQRGVILRELSRYREQVKHRLITINALAPQNVLARGYSITTTAKGTVRSSRDVASGDTLQTHLADGTISSVAI